MTTAIVPAPTRADLAVPESFKAPHVHWRGTRTAEIGNFLEKLRDEQGKLTTDVIIQAAQKAGSILRDFFEWSGPKAAKKFRRYQARMLMSRLLVESNRDLGPIRAYCAVRIRGEPYQRVMYIPLTAALQTDHYRAEIVGRLRTRAKSYEAHLSTMQAYRKAL